MPFVSDKQRKFLYMNNPDVAKKFAKHSKKETIDGSLGDVYAVQQPYDGCQVGKLVHQVNPVMGMSQDQVPHDQIAATFPDKERATSFANGLYMEYCQKQEALEEKKNKVTEKLKKAMSQLEKKRSGHMDMIKENPMVASKSKHEVANLTQKIDELMMKLEMIESSKKQLDNKKGKDAIKGKKPIKENSQLSEVQVKTSKASDLQFILIELGKAYGEGLADDQLTDEFKNYTIGQIIEDWKNLKG